MKKTLTKTLLILILLSGTIASKAQTNWQYSVDQTNCKKVYFYDSVMNFRPSSYHWDFGDSNTSNQANPIHTYTAAGSYLVTLTAMDSANNQNITDTFTITLNCGPCANFKISAWNYVDQGNCKKVNFVNQSSSGTYLWSFGDGNTSTLRSPSHTYAKDSNYVVTLKVTDSLCMDSMSYNVKIDCKPDPCKNFKAAGTFFVDSSDCKKVYFTNLSSIANYTWTFGDGNSSTAKNPTHTYAKDGNYSVYIIAQDSFCFDSSYIQVTLDCSPSNPCKNFKANIFLSIDSSNSSKAKLYNKTTGNVTNHFWDFGDGSTSTSATPSHTYTKSGQLTITYIASDSINNCIDTATVSFTVDSLGNIRRGNINVTIDVIDQTQNANSVSSIDSKTFNIFPNPAKNQIIIRGQEIEQILIYNIQGKLMHSISTNKNQVEVDCSNWPRGMYFISTGGNQSQKLVIQ